MMQKNQSFSTIEFCHPKISVSWEGMKKSSDGFIFKTGICSIPHDDKRNKGGEDAFVVTPTLIVVADGVGGWAAKGVDSGLFSK